MPANLSIAPLPFREAIAWALSRGVSLAPDFYAALQDEAVRNSFTVTGIAELDQVAAVKRSLDAAIAQGKTLAQWKQEADVQALALSAVRKELIFRQATQTAYGAGRWKQQQANKAARPFLLYDAINDSRTRPTHLAMDGYIAPVDDPVWQRWQPPAGFRCRCSTVAISEKQAVARGWRGSPPPVPAEPDPGFGWNPGEDYSRMLRNLADDAKATAPHAIGDAYDAQRRAAEQMLPVTVAAAGGDNAALLALYRAAPLAKLREARAAMLAKEAEIRDRIAAPRDHAFAGATEAQLSALRGIIWPRDADAFGAQASFLELLIALKESL